MTSAVLVPEHVHVTTVWIEAPLETVWGCVADPLRYPEIYSSWSDSTVDPTRKQGLYRVNEGDGDGADLTIETSRHHGAVDLELLEADGTLRRHTRVFDVDGGCLVVELAERGGLATSDFDALVGSIETDVRHAKRIIEAKS
jgi:hypothetical protein